MRKLIPNHTFIALLVSAGLSSAHAASYVKTPSGELVRTGSGDCVLQANQRAGELTPGCDPMNRVILLPDADGNVGAVSVSVGGTSELIDTAYGSLGVNDAGELAQTPSSESEVGSRFSTLLSSQPQGAASYTLRFESGSATELTPESLVLIDQMIEELANRSAPEIRVTGHTDTVGAADVNDRLSRDRAQSVVERLAQNGISLDMLEAAGRGERELLVPTADNVDEQQNRRVEISVR